MKHKNTRILLAEVNPDIRSAMTLLLETRLSAHVTAEADSMERLLSSLAVSKPDIVIMDCELPGLPKEDRAAAIRSIVPGIKIVITSSRPENAYVGKEMQADSFVCKSGPPEQVIHVLEQL